ncbi:MAG TPA: hypothetical protein VFF15_07025 [Flavobacteriaceae bacterium]|nr:hypothetical protein [Flavobacteriaceae bacterium]
MKKAVLIFGFTCLSGLLSSTVAQDMAYASVYTETELVNEIPTPTLVENTIRNTDTIPDFNLAKTKIKLTGIIYEQDGKTPAKDVELSLYQKNEEGRFEALNTEEKPREIRHKGVVKTAADGRYTFYTFMPGKALRSYDLKEIYLIVKVPGKEEVGMHPIVFDNDPLLKKSCRKKLIRKGINNIVVLQEEQGLQVGTKDIVVEGDYAEYK